jgi:arylsulfatase A-like enzyme
MDHGIANEAVHNIPMILRWPEVTTKPGRNDAMVYNLDLCPTLCELLGFPTPTRWDGRSFAPALRGESFAGWPYQVWDHGIYTLTRAVRTPDWLMIRVLHPGLYPYDEPVLLHDMRSDPHQAINVAYERPEVVGELSALLADWRQQQLQKGAPCDPLEAMVPQGVFPYYSPEQMVARLEKTGRGRQAAELKRRLNRYDQGHHA